MKTYALIENAVVVNVVVWDGNPDTWQPPEGLQAVEIPEDVPAAIGHGYVDGKFIIPEPVAADPVALVPASVTKRQAVLALFDAGKLDAVNAAIDAAGSRSRAEWEASSTVERQSPLVLQLGQALALDLDALFVAAAAL